MPVLVEVEEVVEELLLVLLVPRFALAAGAVLLLS
jgi:hypothetical protein